MFYYRVTHKYMLFDHIEKKDIGIYSSLEKGDRLPSLEYIYNFCKMFDVSIELMLN